MAEFLARDVARRACEVIRDSDRRTACIELLTRILIHGDSVKDEVRKEIRRMFTEEERKLLKQKLAELLG
ncbi:MAG: hypothetical protein QXL22_06130 [Candidatus Nezhaarchaeales archaeon]